MSFFFRPHIMTLTKTVTVGLKDLYQRVRDKEISKRLVSASTLKEVYREERTDLRKLVLYALEQIDDERLREEILLRAHNDFIRYHIPQNVSYEDDDYVNKEYQHIITKYSEKKNLKTMKDFIEYRKSCLYMHEMTEELMGKLNIIESNSQVDGQ
jgi:hypothetical protein